MADYDQGMNMAQAYGATQNRIAGAPPPLNPSPVNPSMFNAFEGIQSEASHMLQRACNLADRLVGPLPASTGADKQPAPNGLFEDASMRLSHIRTCILAATQAIERIEAKLP